MRVACFCGREYQAAGQLAVCPGCGEPAVLPNVTSSDAEAMRRDVAQLVDMPLGWEGDQC
jgi:hypothetical protein